MSGRLRYDRLDNRPKVSVTTVPGVVETPRPMPSNIIARPIKLPPMHRVKGS